MIKKENKFMDMYTEQRSLDIIFIVRRAILLFQVWMREKTILCKLERVRGVNYDSMSCQMSFYMSYQMFLYMYCHITFHVNCHVICVRCHVNLLFTCHITFHKVNKCEFINEHKNSYNCEFMDIIDFHSQLLVVSNNYRILTAL